VGSARREGNGSEECASAKEGDMTATAGRAAGEGRIGILPPAGRPAARTGTLGSL